MAEQWYYGLGSGTKQDTKLEGVRTNHAKSTKPGDWRSRGRGGERERDRPGELGNGPVIPTMSKTNVGLLVLSLASRRGWWMYIIREHGVRLYAGDHWLCWSFELLLFKACDFNL